MDVTLTDKNDWIHIGIQGRIDSFNQQILDEKLSTLSHAGKKKIIINLLNSNYLSLSAAWLICRSEKKNRLDGGEMHIACEKELSRKLLQLFSTSPNMKILSKLEYEAI